SFSLSRTHHYSITPRPGGRRASHRRRARMSSKTNCNRQERSFQRGDGEGDAAPDLKIRVLCDLDRFVCLIGRVKPGTAVYKPEAFNRKLVIEPSDHDAAVSDRLGAVDHEQIAVVDAGAEHRIADHAHEVSGLGALHQVLGDVEGVFEI